MENTSHIHQHVEEDAGCCSHHSHQASTGHNHDTGQHSEDNRLRAYLPVVISATFLLTGLAAEHWLKISIFKGFIAFAWYLAAYIPVGWPVMKEAFTSLWKKDYFNEFFLMTLATTGAFYIGEYAEGVAVMLFYSFGELLQGDAVKQARKNIRALLDVRPKEATLLKNGQHVTVDASSVQPGETVVIMPGGKVSLDGQLESDSAVLNTAALTGESKPVHVEKGGNILAGSLVMDSLIYINVTKKFEDSAVAKIIELAQNAASQKAPTEKFIRKFAKVYTPVVVLCAVLIILLPFLYSLFAGSLFVFDDWLYRALVFLVISCPCALVVSIPLGYFGGIGAASRNGILVKGGNYLDTLAKIKTVVTDKTGTLTKGIFEVQQVVSEDISHKELLSFMAALEAGSTHPIARAVVEYAKSKNIDFAAAESVKEISGKGVIGQCNEKSIAVGNQRLMQQLSVNVSHLNIPSEDSVLYCAIDGKLAGYLIIADSLKDDAIRMVSEIKSLGINRIVMISGDNNAIVQKTARQTGIQEAYGDCMPDDKVNKVSQIKSESAHPVAFVGDGFNDAPVLAMSDVGIAMGHLGSDAAIEMADVIIQSDQPSKIPVAIKIGKKTQNIVLQNISMAFGVKLIVLLMGAGGVATLWEAVFADVGVALLAILNAIRIQKMNFNIND
jgi:Cd2+/Zn2+-exporting ATPase